MPTTNASSELVERVVKRVEVRRRKDKQVGESLFE
jgi:hypothetical protein